MTIRLLLLCLVALWPSVAAAQVTYPSLLPHTVTAPQPGDEFPWNISVSPYAVLTGMQDTPVVLKAPVGRRFQLTVTSEAALSGTVEATVGSETLSAPVSLAGPGDVSTGIFQSVTTPTTAPTSIRFCNDFGCSASLDLAIQFDNPPARPSNPRLSQAVAAILRLAAEEIDRAQ